jgi:hypothetical protein
MPLLKQAADSPHAGGVFPWIVKTTERRKSQW